MKIPQREDRFQLGATQTQPGRAVQPIEGSLGDSYTKTMQGMAKQFDEISKMQFQLSENAVKGQLNAFDIYVDSRTKQYDKDIQLATSKEQIDGLYAQYREDIAKNGADVLGYDLYQNWERVKGGTTLANAQYAGAVANTVLLNKQNKELYKTAADSLNIEAGNANGKERQEKINQFIALTKENVSNGTLTGAEAENQIHQFNYNLDKTQIMRDINEDEDEALKKLKTNSYAPTVTYPERQKFITLINNNVLRKRGTSSSQRVEGATSIWVEMHQAPSGFGKAGTIVLENGKETKLEKDSEIPYYNEEGKKVGILHGSFNDIAYQIADISHGSITATRYIMQALYKKAGKDVPLSEISRDDAEKFQKNMDGYVFDNLSPQYQDFSTQDDAIQGTWNQYSLFYKNDKDAQAGLDSSANAEQFLYRFENNELHNIKLISNIVQAANEVNDKINSPKYSLYIHRNKKTEDSYIEKRNAYTDILVSAIQNDNVLQPQTTVEKEMKTVLKPILDKIDTQYRGFDTKVKKRNFLQGLMDTQDFFKIFDSENEDYFANPKNKTFDRALLVAAANAHIGNISREQEDISYMDSLYYSPVSYDIARQKKLSEEQKKQQYLIGSVM